MLPLHYNFFLGGDDITAQGDSEASTVIGGLLQLQKHKSTSMSSKSGLQIKTNKQHQSSSMPLQVLQKQKQTNPNVIHANIYGMK
jgi:hypothetical protein